MDAVKFLQEKKRMQLEDQRFYIEFLKSDFTYEERVKAVENWSKEHPIKTRLQDFLEKYPDAEIDHDENRPFSICAARLGYLRVDDCQNDCAKCWNEPLQ